MIPRSVRSKVEAALARQAAVALEVEPTDLTRLWLRGGFPDSFLSATDGDSLNLRESFIRTYLERDVPMLGLRIPAETLRRLWTMLAHNQGTLLNASRLASGLSISAPTVTSDIDLLVDLLLELGGQRGTWVSRSSAGSRPSPSAASTRHSKTSSPRGPSSCTRARTATRSPRTSRRSVCGSWRDC